MKRAAMASMVALVMSLLGISVSSLVYAQSPTITPTSTPTATSARPAESTEPVAPTPTDTPIIKLTPIIFETTQPTATQIPVFSLQPGTIEGSVNDSAPRARYRFDGGADQGVSIVMEATSGSLDPFLYLFDSNGTLIASNDDRAPGDRSAAIVLTLPSDGAYIIEATRFAQGETLTSGTFRLTLTLSGEAPTDEPSDPFARPPSFGVPYDLIAYQDIGLGRVNSTSPVYFAFAGQQGDLVRLIVTRTGGDLNPRVRILNAASTDIGRESQTRETESIAYATLPQTGWYLVEVSARGGAGSFDVFLNRLANAVLQVGDPLIGEFTAESPTVAYIVNARIGDRITATMFTTDAESGVAPQMELLDLNLRQIARATGERFVTVRADVPRSAPYILRVSNLDPAASGSFNLRLSSVPANVDAFGAQTVSYNDDYTGTITADDPVNYYRFSGKTGELITIQMEAAGAASGLAPTGSVGTAPALDPYLILMDTDLNELIANDDSGGGRSARIVQFRLPKDGDYLILASRSGLAGGTTQGDYILSIRAGAVRLTPGAISATLQWTGRADMNLFVRDPENRIVTWSSPTVPSGGYLQIDSNTGCGTPSDEPVEHIVWEGERAPIGDFVIWAWYQASCDGSNDPESFTLTVRVGTETILTVQEVLNAGQRFEASVRVSSEGRGFVINSGVFTQPSAQQSVSEGGDPLIRYGDEVLDSLNNDVYARFYQFFGAQGDQIRVRVERTDGNLDPLVVLRDAADVNLPGALNDDASVDTRDAELIYTLPSDGQYVIAVFRYGLRDGTTSGGYRLTLERIEPS